MSIIANLGWVALTFVVGGFVAVLAIAITAMFELMRMIKYAWFKFVVVLAHWLKIKNDYIYDLTDFVTRIAEADADKAAKFREWEYTQWKKKS
jgi:hypothetical protein